MKTHSGVVRNFMTSLRRPKIVAEMLELLQKIFSRFSSVFYTLIRKLMTIREIKSYI